jgi:hypothetical protein
MQGLLVFRELQMHFMKQDEKRNNRPEAYPKPSKTDNQLNSQDEFIGQRPNDLADESVSNTQLKETNRPEDEIKDGRSDEENVRDI